MTQEVNHSNQPNAIAELLKGQQEMYSLLERLFQNPESNSDKILNVEQTAKFLGLSKASIYLKVSSGELPHMKKSKRLYFSTKDLIEYLRSGAKNVRDSEQGAEQFLTKKRGA